MATEYITVTSVPPLNVTVSATGSNIVQIEQTEGSSINVTTGLSMPAETNLVVSEQNPNLQDGGMWVQTFDNGDFTLWIEDGE